MHCDHEGIAACTNYYIVQMTTSFHVSIGGLMDNALGFHLGVLRPIPAWGNIELVSKFVNVLFLNEDTLAIVESEASQYLSASLLAT